MVQLSTPSMGNDVADPARIVVVECGLHDATCAHLPVALPTTSGERANEIHHAYLN